METSFRCCFVFFLTADVVCSICAYPISGVCDVPFIRGETEACVISSNNKSQGREMPNSLLHLLMCCSLAMGLPGTDRLRGDVQSVWTRRIKLHFEKDCYD